MSSDASSVFITNLQWWTTDSELEQLCAAYGQVVNVRFIEDRSCGKSRGMAVVEFQSPESVGQCINGLSGQEINGRPCKVTPQNAGRGGMPGMAQNMQGGRGFMGQPGPGRGGMGGRGRGNMMGPPGGMPPPPPGMMGGPPGMPGMWPNPMMQGQMMPPPGMMQGNMGGYR